MIPTTKLLNEKEKGKDIDDVVEDVFTLAMQVEKDRSLTSIYDYDNLDHQRMRLAQ